MQKYDRYREDNVRDKTGFMFYLYYLYAMPGPNVPLHWHDELEIMLSKAEGVMILDGKHIVFHEGDVLFINPRQLHNTYHMKAGWSYHVLISPELLYPPGIVNTPNKKYYFPDIIEAANATAIRQIIEELLQIPTPVSEENRFFVMSKLFDILNNLIKDGYPIFDSKENPTLQSGYIKDSLDYIHNNITHKILVEDIANEVGLSKEYLMRLFKLYTGETVNSYIKSYRLDAAKTDLAAGKSLTDIIYKYHYSDIAYFCKIFKKQYGISPGKFK